MKLCEDAMNQIVWQDDSLVVDLNVTKQFGAKPYTFIEVTELNEQAQERAA